MLNKKFINREPSTTTSYISNTESGSIQTSINNPGFSEIVEEEKMPHIELPRLEKENEEKLSLTTAEERKLTKSLYRSKADKRF